MLRAVLFLVIAAAGLAALVATGSHGGSSKLWGLTDPWEMTLHIGFARAALYGPSVHGWYVHAGPSGYLPPFELLALPLAPLPDPVAAVVGRCLTAAAVFLGLWLWNEKDGGVRSALWPAMISLPAMQAVVDDHLFSALGLAALSLALWAQRRHRWYLAGAALAIGSIRLANALPVAAMLLVGAWGSPRSLLKALAAGVAVVAPLVAMTTLADPQWIADFRMNFAQYPLAGWPRFALAAAGTVGVAALQVVVSGVAAWIVRRQAGHPLDADRAALGLALSIISAPGEGPYTGIYALPALTRVGGRPDVALLPWIASGAAWAALVVAALFWAGPGWQAVWSLFTLVSTWFLVNEYPLLRTRRPASISAA